MANNVFWRFLNRKKAVKYENPDENDEELFYDDKNQESTDLPMLSADEKFEIIPDENQEKISVKNSPATNSEVIKTPRKPVGKGNREENEEVRNRESKNFLSNKSERSQMPPGKFIDIREAFTKLTGAVNKTQSVKARAEIQKAKEQIVELLSSIEVIAFIGPSGTGKSTRAIRVAKKLGIHYIIDDGLLINGSKIVAGLSAKRAKSKLESVRQALYVDENRAEGMRRALGENLPSKLMILGTSDGMLQKICDNLWLQKPSSVVRIEEVTTEQERRTAVHVRSTQGQHTIPVPSMEIKHEFSGYFSDPLNRILRRREKHDAGIIPSDIERTVVRPTFSSLGSYSISDEALADLAKIIIERKVPGVAELLKFQIEKQSYGVVLFMEVSLYYGYNAQEVLSEVQNFVSRGIEDYTSINIMLANIKAKRLITKGKTGE